MLPQIAPRACEDATAPSSMRGASLIAGETPEACDFAGAKTHSLSKLSCALEGSAQLANTVVADSP